MNVKTFFFADLPQAGRNNDCTAWNCKCVCVKGGGGILCFGYTFEQLTASWRHFFAN